MASPPIAVTLSKFEQLEILRAEIELRESELKGVEKQIRDCLFELERQRFLQTIHPVFSQLAPPEQSAHLPQLNANREMLADAIRSMQAVMTQLESETAGLSAPPSRNPGLQRPGAPAPAAGAAPRRAKFDSFEDFRAAKPGGT